MTEETPPTGIERCIEIAGSQQAVADLLGITQQSVYQMKVKGFAPIDHINRLHETYGVERRKLCDPKLVAMLFPGGHEQ